MKEGDGVGIKHAQCRRIHSDEVAETKREREESFEQKNFNYD